MSRTQQRVKSYAELRGNPENSRIKSRLDNTNWYQEKGTSKMEARPFVRPAAERVRADMANEVRRISASQGIPLISEAAIVRCAALAVQDRMKEIADRKGIRDTGQLINSIRIAEVS
ncbi:hypothetical protein DJ84_18420 [Halorubrum ezzemoulense]|nr:hypothetical protein DJ84_18420 [Halorubrum ezzemoulense]